MARATPPRRYGEQIAPDEIEPYADDAAQRARAWLAKASGCRGGS